MLRHFSEYKSCGLVGIYCSNWIIYLFMLILQIPGEKGGLKVSDRYMLIARVLAFESLR